MGTWQRFKSGRFTAHEGGIVYYDKADAMAEVRKLNKQSKQQKTKGTFAIRKVADHYEVWVNYHEYDQFTRNR